MLLRKQPDDVHEDNKHWDPIEEKAHKHWHNHRIQETESTNKPLKHTTHLDKDIISTIVVQPLSRKHLANNYL